jgi:ABC-2 type transport system permease protein
MYWSVRRELWENRSIYVAPLAGAAVFIVGFLISLIWLPRDVREIALLDPAQQTNMLAHPFAHADMLIMLIAFITGIFYSLDALHGERRDRSILFWKSMPVSDRTTVLAKAAIPLVVLPLLAFAISVGLQFIAWLLSLAVLAASGAGAAILWTRLPLFEMQLVTLYSAAVMVLWHAPIYMWMLLVSGWARRAAFLWAVMPPAAIAVVEYIAFHTSYVGSVLHDRLGGFVAAAYDLTDKNGVPVDPHFIPLTRLTPGRFLSSPSLWIGLVFAAIFFAAAVRQRRYREPL